MLRTVIRFALLVLLMSFASTGARLSAQATVATASRRADLQLGGGVAYAASADYGPAITGFKLYGTYDFKTHFGAEVAFNQINSHDGSSLGERTYEIGGRYVLHYGNFNPYARVMYGRGVFNFPNNIANLAYNMGVVGGGVDYNLRTHINVRADYEYQNWFGFPPHGLTPHVVSIGVAYHF